jgi:hypothetical protein
MGETNSMHLIARSGCIKFMGHLIRRCNDLGDKTQRCPSWIITNACSLLVRVRAIRRCRRSCVSNQFWSRNFVATLRFK